MRKALLDWLDSRTGYRGILHALLFEAIPGGARWRYVWGSTLVFAFTVQLITGFFLWMSYSPSSQSAWESVYYIQHQMSGGWLLRGIHHFMAQAMIVLLALHFLQVVIDGAYRAPREFNFWIGLILLQIVLGLSLTGYLLPWDQKGYWATKVATNIMKIVPVVGPAMQRVVIGGPDYGHHTLTRFFALHAGLLPALMVVFIGAHLYVFRRHGIHAVQPKRRPDAYFWVDQMLKDAVACLAVLAVVIFLIVRHGLMHWDAWKTPGVMGAELGAPANPFESYSAARPEWYFLFLFQFLKYFKGHDELYGAVIIPSIVMLLLFLMPIVGRWRLGHRFNIALLIALLGGVAFLTSLALVEDRNKQEYKIAVKQAEEDSLRVVELAQRPEGIPVTGAVNLLMEDPKSVGPRLFKQHCSSCHTHADVPMPAVAAAANGSTTKPGTPTGGSDLTGIASRTWLSGFLDPKQIDGPKYFGKTKFNGGKMSKFVHKDVAEYSDAEKKNLDKLIAAISAEAELPRQRAMDAGDAAMIAEGKAVFKKGDIRCGECHQFHDMGEDGGGPDLTSYGSYGWLTAFLNDPGDDRFYGKRNDRMPAFGKKGLLDKREMDLMVRWLRRDWYRPNEAPMVKAATTQVAGP